MGYLEVTGPDPAPGEIYSNTEIIGQLAAWFCVCDVFCHLETLPRIPTSKKVLTGRSSLALGLLPSTAISFMNLSLYKLMTLWYQVVATENRLNRASCLADSRAEKPVLARF